MSVIVDIAGVVFRFNAVSLALGLADHKTRVSTI
jgi:hypothetical protein